MKCIALLFLGAFFAFGHAMASDTGGLPCQPIMGAGKVFDIPSLSGLSEGYLYDDVVRRMQAMTKRYSALHISPIGKSAGVIYEWSDVWLWFTNFQEVDSRDLYALEFGAKENQKGQIIIVAGHHATEPAGPLAALSFVEALLEAGGEKAKTLREQFAISVIPIVDADQFSRPFAGRTYSMLNNYYHRLKESGPQWKDQGKGRQSVARALPEARHIAKYLADHRHTNQNVLFDLHEAASATTDHTGFFVVRPPWGQEKLGEHMPHAEQRVRSAGFPIDRRGDRDGREPEQLSILGRSRGFLSYTQESPRYGESHDVIVDIHSRVAMHLLSMDEILARILDGQ